MKVLVPRQASGRCIIIATTFTRPPSIVAASRRCAESARQGQECYRDRRQYTSATLRSSAVPPADVGPSSSSAQRAQKAKRIAVFVSGGGSNFRAIHASIQAGACYAEIAVVVTNAPSCGGAEYATAHGIPVEVYPPHSPTSNGLTPEQLTETLKNDYAVDYIILAGYMKLVPASLVRSFQRAILNIHPALLPSFGGKGYYGIRVHEAVVASGARFSGPTVHFVDEEYDRGPILAQAIVPVLPTDSPEALAARVLKKEHELYPQCVAALCEGRVTWRCDGVPIIWSSH